MKQRRRHALLADAEAAEHRVQHVLDIHCAGHATERVRRAPQVLGRELAGACPLSKGGTERSETLLEMVAVPCLRQGRRLVGPDAGTGGVGQQSR